MTDWIDHERTRQLDDAAKYWPDAPIPDCELAKIAAAIKEELQ